MDRYHQLTLGENQSRDNCKDEFINESKNTEDRENRAKTELGAKVFREKIV
jgi:hypothetical protein